MVGSQCTWSYSELDQKSRRLAHIMQLAGVRRDGVVALMLKRSPSLILAQVAVLRLGAAYSPLDTQSPSAHLQAVLNVLRPMLVLTDGSCEVLTQPGCRVIDLRTIDFDAIELGTIRLGTIALGAIDFDTEDDSVSSWADCTDESVAYVTFTSGTTGQPKGVMIPHSGISRLVCDPDWASFDASTRFGFISSPAFDASTLEVWAPLFNGGCCLLQEKAKPSLDDIANFILQNRVTDVFLTSALFSAMVEHRLDSFAGLRQLATGGERVSPHHARIVLNTYPSVRLINGYGPTENTTFTACRTITIADCDNPGGIPIGSPIRGTCVRVGTDDVDTNYGELLAGGSGVAIGYLNDAELTDRKFVTIDGARWYKTGDLVRRRADGVLEFEGRIDRQVKVQGHRIELDAIEALVSSLPGIGQCAVFVAGDFATNRHLVAIYTLVHGTCPTPAEILEFLRAHLPAHSIPRVLRAVAAMPRNANGKIDVRELQSVHAAAVSLASTASKPSNDTEQRLCQLWAELFPSVNIHPLLNFDALGATSLQALQLSAAIRGEFQKFFSAIQVIRTPVLRDQAAIIEQLPVRAPETSRAIDNTRPHELTQIQHAVLAADALDESGCAFLVHVALRFETPAILERIPDAFARLAERHPALRLSIDDTPGICLASVDGTLKPGWFHHQGALPVSHGGEALPAEVLRIINRPLNRASDGVMRVDTWGGENNTALVVWTIHHVAIDEASIDRCLSDLDALLGGQSLPPVVGNPFGLAAFERQRTAVTAPQYWTSRIVDALGHKPPALPRAPGFGGEVSVEIPTSLAQSFIQSCRAQGVTPFVPLLVAYGRAMQSVFGNEYAFVATPFARRGDPAVDDVVGCLIDLNIVEAGALPNETLAENLGRVYGAAARLQESSFFPFERVSTDIARRKPGAERHLNSFAFTWRLAPDRSLTLGGTPARLLRVAQQGARFGMTLHGWLEDGQLRCSIEMLDDAVSRDKAAQVARHFVGQLALVAGVGFVPALPQMVVDGVRFSSKLFEALKLRWIQNTGISASEFSEDANFWELGGNSLTALQLFAQLSKEFGVHIDPVDFFAVPTFANLHRLASSTRARADVIHDVIGNPDARRLVVLFPGDNGSGLVMHGLGEHLHRLLGDDFAIVTVEIEEILRRAPVGGLTAFVNNRCLQLFDELGRDRIASLVGFSSGGLTALAVAREFSPTSVPSVWLLDTYTPVESVPTKLFNGTARRVIRRLLRYSIVAKLLRTHVRTVTAPKLAMEVPVGSIEHIREQARVELLNQRPALAPGAISLVQATKTANSEFLMWNRKTNGFAAGNFARGSVVGIDCLHEDLVGKYAEQTAGYVADSIRGLGVRA